ncbi:hypothetical protein PaG_06280 [Moesziomyces aphidis]|uniref:Dol-P-Man:Man(5)GlcNAc(2)-PP-Dol alpha-1,3-mannosyltransferase n=1 Tax=Moesziomyces aphidis TaxID=84754 RepID=W3VG52_MOEAP|nr:hypothetical protein PaG_06280 [Moesziomyces aphidis]
MQRSAALAWLRRVCLDDHGYNYALPALAIASAVLSQAVVRRISFTEIDFQTYIAQASLFLKGERTYTNLDPLGGSGPCVYPAAHIYIYAFFHWLTDGGQNILPAQNVFAALFTINVLVVALLYRNAGMPPIALLPLILSKRIASIFLLRMFNDPIAILFVYLSLLAIIKARWSLSALLFGVGLGVKMNVLLFLPGIVASCFAYTGFNGTISYVSIVAAVQAIISLPFTLHDPHAYLVRAFDFSRAFLHVWTVNWRFVSERTFLSSAFAKGLLALHLILLALFGICRWTPIWTNGPAWIVRNMSTRKTTLAPSAKITILGCAFASNLIGVLCSRSLHYQFYSWYFHQLPFVLWFSKLPLVVKLALPVALEWCWNVFPSTDSSSLVLLACHVLLVLACFTLPAFADSYALAQRALRLEENEVDLLLSNDVSHEHAAATDSQSDDEEDDALDRIAQARLAREAREEKIRAAFRRRIQTRRKLLALLGRICLILRSLLILLALALLFVIPHPRSPVSKGTYVDENALQPGQARVYWDYFDVTYADMVSEKVAFLASESTEARADFVWSELQSYGLDVQQQKYQYRSGAGEDSQSGTNVYARSATPRIDGREAVVITASWQSRWKGQDDPFAHVNATEASNGARVNVRGIASVLALARYLSTQAHLSKDLIFVISDGHLEGINAWSSAYFGDVAAGLEVEPVVLGGSQVWNAISIDYPADSFSSLVVQYEGFDGQLPNMDAINTIVRIADSVAGSIPIDLEQSKATSLLKQPAHRLAQRLGISLRADVEYELDSYEHGVRAALRQFGHGVAGHASGPHGFFQRHHVDAITIYAVPATGPYGFFHMGRLVESFVRSMSNLIERLHHSQFFYLLLSPRRFVPIGIAILVPLFLSISLTISGFASWLEQEAKSKKLRHDVLETLKDAQQDAGDVQPEAPTMSWYRQKLVEKSLARGLDAEIVADADGTAASLVEAMRPCAATLACIGSTVVVGMGMLHHCASLADSITSPDAGKTNFPVAALVGSTLVQAAEAIYFRSQCSSPRRRRIGSLLIAFAYLQAGMLVAVLSVLNFALATVLALLAYPALAAASSARFPQNPLSAMARYAVIALFSPATWAVLLQIFPTHMGAAVVRSLMTHYTLFQAATVPVFCMAYLPIVLQAQLGLLLTT